METGCQNVQLCVAILKVAFPPHVIGPMFLFPLLYITFQCTEALLLALCFRCYQTFKPPAEGKCHSCLCMCVFVEWGWDKKEEHKHSAHCMSVLNETKQMSNLALLLHRNKKIRCWCCRGCETTLASEKLAGRNKQHDCVTVSQTTTCCWRGKQRPMIFIPEATNTQIIVYLFKRIECKLWVMHVEVGMIKNCFLYSYFCI